MQIHIFEDQEALASGAAEFISQAAEAAIQARGQFNIALSGGSTPQACFEKLAAPPYSEEIDWAHVHVFWSDERCVPPDDAQSNYGNAKRVLLDRVPLPVANIHRIQAELPPADAAQQYRDELAKHFAIADTPRFDLILLGLGEDGHTASLFPDSPELNSELLVTENYAAKLDSWRVTFTFPLINAAQQVAFLAVGSKKSEIIKAVIEDKEKQLPAVGVQPLSGDLRWLLDKAAASKLAKQLGSD